ncbi:tRNA pseudouridine(38-40) synthase TruA [Pedomonas mirosovicensis]|uniref:tRNA pseudouridine(38-40) synthase TruA n=1 Tax=Pedomonas mirosovicensis TaxID=2908641 RepID=UPI002169F365|nr:tRNA pseudouridine(38-40) synthase TruA [Pedomonas mirosovicensis]MCH8685799.1 tRNA pseudouridine(38-40) synthase TruA [Pedomonas mirosovicensis]
MTRFRLTVEFDGRPFMGWQFQEHGPSVQGALEEAVYKITGEEAQVIAAGRTDAGVHALAMTAHVDIEKPFTPFKLREALNARLRPDPVAVLECEIAEPDFHARFSATKRSYRYRIINRRAPLTFDKGLAWQVAVPLDHEAMHAAAQILVGKHDFTTFRSVHCQSASPLKTLDKLIVSRWGDEIIVETEARSFLHHQVRSMVGCLKLVGEGKWTARDLEKALHACDRAALGFNAPPDGLYFVAAGYEPLPAAAADEPLGEDDE